MEGDTPAQEAARKKLGEALVAFIKGLATSAGSTGDDVMRRVHTENFRIAVDRAAAQGVEASFAWTTLGAWMEEGKERIGCFSRALEVMKKEPKPQTAHALWSRAHMLVECHYEIGRVHAHEGDPEVAREFLEKARSFIFAMVMSREEANKEGANIADDHIEGKIAALLLQLPDKDEEPG